MALLVNRLCNCTPRTDNPGHTINTILHVTQCSGKVQLNAIETGHTIIQKAMQVDTQLGHTINTAGGDCSLPTIGGSSPGHSVPRGSKCLILIVGSKCLMPQNINDQYLQGLSKEVSRFLSFLANCHWCIPWPCWPS